LISSATATDETAAAPSRRRDRSSPAEALLARFRTVRDFTSQLCAGLAPEDCVVQSMPDVSPAKWHLAHTTWFFETFILKKWIPAYQPEVPQYAYLFNSYYNAAGDMHRRDLRGLISRPTVEETHRYRSSVDSHIADLLSGADDKALAEIEPLIILGIHHEQQHQELLNFTEAIVDIGHDGSGFSYDNEGPRHRALIPAFALASRPVTNGEYLEFIEAGGYTRPEFWLSLGWTTVNEQRWQAPLYWSKSEGGWWNFTLSGYRPVNESEPVTHISYFEADAFANWSQARLPTEFEWEHAAGACAIEGNFVDEETFHPQTGR
jgi:hypothetical protein